jgi:hypothetical protein
MVSASGQAVFAIIAKDAASKVMKNVGRSFGGMKSVGEKAFAAIKVGAAAAAAALVAMGIASVNAAIQDEASSTRLLSALKARGFAQKNLTEEINKSIAAGQNLGFTDDEVRASLENATRFTKDFAKAQKIAQIAQQVSRTTGQDLATATLNVGKAYAGAGGRLLSSLGITKKGIKGQQALNAIYGKTQGAADAYSKTTAGRFATAQIKLNEAFEKLGYKFLPVVNQLLTFFTNRVLPIVNGALDAFSKGLDELTIMFQPLIKAVGELISTLGDGEGSPLVIVAKAIGAAFQIAGFGVKVFVDILTDLIKIINQVLVLLGQLGDAIGGAAGSRIGFGSGVSVPGMVSGVNGGSVNTSVQFNIGTQKQDQMVSSSIDRLRNQSRNP